MLESRDSAEVLTTLRTAARLLSGEAEQLRRHAVSLADRGSWDPAERYRALRDMAVDLHQLAAEIAAEAER